MYIKKNYKELQMKTIQSVSKKFMSMVAAFGLILFFIMANSCGGGSSSSTAPTTAPPAPPVPTVEAPGAPTNFTVVGTPNASLSATLKWTAPITGGEPTSYEIYRSTTAGTVFDPANHRISLPAVEGQTTYEFIDNVGLNSDEDTYWVVAAKNTIGEAPTSEVLYTPVEAPGAPMNFVVAASAAGGDLSATLSWLTPVTGGETTSYEIYRSTTADNIFDPDNHLISLPATTYEFIDNAGLERGVTTYWIVAAKNAGGETPTLPQGYTPPGGGAGEVDKYGNNFAAAIIFADGIGILNEDISGEEWTENNISLVNPLTGLRPSETELLTLNEFPYFDENTTFVKDGVTYYKQKTVSTWQGEWIDGSTLPEHNVTAKWGDNLISQTLNTESIVRVEMVLTKALDTNMTAYNMVSLYGEKDVEIYGTDGTTYETNTSFVFATNARLTIQQVDGLGGDPTIRDADENQTLFDTSVLDGPGKFAAEINVAGNLVYGYVWDLKQNPVPAGTYRITFSLDDSSASTGTPNNVTIGEVAVSDEGENPYTTPVLDSPTKVHIDITIN